MVWLSPNHQKKMDKPSSIIEALKAGKLPSTLQFNQFIDYLERVGIVSVEEASKDAKDIVMEAAEAAGQQRPEIQAQALSAQGKVLADDLRNVLSADKKLLNDKNGALLITSFFFK